MHPLTDRTARLFPFLSSIPACAQRNAAQRSATQCSAVYQSIVPDPRLTTLAALYRSIRTLLLAEQTQPCAFLHLLFPFHHHHILIIRLSLTRQDEAQPLSHIRRGTRHRLRWR